MELQQIFILALMFYVAPVLVGVIFTKANTPDYSPVFCWIAGQMLLWSGFLVLGVPMILVGRPFHELVWGYTGILAAMLIPGMVFLAGEGRKRKQRTESIATGTPVKGPDKATVFMWIVFWLLLGLQLVQAVRLSYADWDDAYYVATTTVTLDADTMYRRVAYSGGESTLDLRHGLAPFPIWIAYLSRISGMHPATASHIGVPFLLIPMTYGIYYLISKKLFGERKDKSALFMVFTAVLVLFGNYSIYTVENFMLARSRQGKAALGSIAIPFLIYVFLCMMEQLEKKHRIQPYLFVLLELGILSACLCSTMGAFLVCLMLGAAWLCAGAFYKEWKLALYLGGCAAPAVLLMLLYGIMK